jgi:hypothetical protein
VEHSKDAKIFSKVSAISANGSEKYNWLHANPSAGINYYRLKSMDLDGTFAYSRAISFQVGTPKQGVIVYPNPVTDRLFLKDSNIETVKEVTIVNTAGTTVSKYTAPVSSDGMDVKHLSNGIYLLKVTHSDGSLYTHKIVINK